MRNRINVLCAMAWAVNTGCYLSRGQLGWAAILALVAMLYATPTWALAKVADEVAKETEEKGVKNG